MTTLTIKDLAVSQQLDGKNVRGGFNKNVGNINAAIGGNFASPAVVVAPVTMVDLFGLGSNTNAYNLNAAIGGNFASPAAVVAPITMVS
jgi:hypothetical protein